MKEILTIKVERTPELMELLSRLGEMGLHIEGYLDPNEHLTLKEAAEEARRKYISFYSVLMRNGSDLISRPFGPSGDPRITRRNLWKFLSRGSNGPAESQER